MDSSRALADLEEVKAIGGSKSVADRRTKRDRPLLVRNSPRGWNRIAREVSATRQFDVWENARLFALVNLAMADGFIAGFESKYHFNYWRPVTAIRAGGDREWLSYLPTPPVPDYPSTHTVLGAAAATVMARFFNTDFISFLDDERCPLPEHHAQVLELLRSSAGEWRIPSPLRDSLLERGERRLYPGQTHWGLGLRTRVETCEP